MTHEISGATRVCLAMGDPVESSLSPLLHNAGYRSAGLGNAFVYVAARVPSELLAAAIQGLRSLGVRGASVLMPHKSAVLPLLDIVDDVANSIGAANTIVNDDGVLRGFNTDWLGVVGAFENETTLRGKEAAVLGAGGTARAACFGLRERGCKVTIFNRTEEKAAGLAAEFGCRAAGLDRASRLRDFEIILNATSAGMQLESPVPPNVFSPGQVVCDAVYHPLDTQFLQDARAAGALTIFGTEMLLHQGVAQFELFTEKAAPIEDMRRALRAAL